MGRRQVREPAPVLVVILVVLLLVISVFNWSRNYDECRAFGHSMAYCLTAIR